MYSILIIEDEDDIRRGLSGLLSLSGYQTYEASEGYEGIKIATEFLPSLVLCDIVMSGLNGYQVLYALKRNPSTSLIPFIFLTGKADKSDFRYGMNLGADDYISKPFNQDELIKCIQTHITKANQQKQQLQKFRSTLLAVIPHEFLTPLNAILGFSCLALEDLQSNDAINREEFTDYIRYIHTAGDKLLHLVNNYILLSEFSLDETSSIIDKQESTLLSNPKEIIEKNISVLSTKYNRKMDIHFTLENSSIAVSESHFEVCIYEIIDNAFKFSLEGKPVIVLTYNNDQFYTIEVTDHGYGIFPDEVENIDAFVQFQNKTPFRQGLGIGLILAKKIVEHYAGNFNIIHNNDRYTKVCMKFLRKDV
jgi:two-component system, sensor histidine kinase and response regulator